MAYEPLQTLIDKEDNSEIIRNQIGVILVNELANQVVLATAASKPTPSDWNMNVYLERHNPIEDWLNIDPENVDPNVFIPRVNISFDNSSVELNKSDVVKTQGYIGTYFIDVYGFGMAKNKPVGHAPGDEESAFEAQRAIRLIRNILMASTNVDLQLPEVVADRMASSIKMLPMKPGIVGVHHLTAGRLALDVTYLEISPQYQAETLALVNVLVCYAEDGSLLAEMDFDQT